MAQVSLVAHTLGRLTLANTQRVLAVLEEWRDKLEIMRALGTGALPERFRDRAEAAARASLARLYGTPGSSTATTAATTTTTATPTQDTSSEGELLVGEAAAALTGSAGSATREVQLVVEEFSRELHISTEVLQGGTEGSTATGTTLKAEARRALTADVLARLTEELVRYSGAFRVLARFVEHERAEKRLAVLVRERAARVSAETARLEEELRTENAEAEAEGQRQEVEVHDLRQRLAELRSGSAMETKVMRKELRGKADTQRRVLAEREAEMAADLADLRRRIEAEDQVNAMMTQFLEDRYGRLSQQVNEWMNRFETDTEDHSHALEALKAKKERDLVRLYDCRERSREISEEIAKRKKAIELQRDIEALEKKKAAAALVIQSRWRGYQARLAFESMKKRLAARSKKKGSGDKVRLPKIKK
jgi:hypothetical protein